MSRKKSDWFDNPLPDHKAGNAARQEVLKAFEQYKNLVYNLSQGGTNSDLVQELMQLSNRLVVWMHRYLPDMSDEREAIRKLPPLLAEKFTVEGLCPPGHIITSGRQLPLSGSLALPASGSLASAWNPAPTIPQAANDAIAACDNIINLELLAPAQQAGRTSTNDARDRYCYEQKKAGRTWKQIQVEVNLRKGWDALHTEQGASQAAKRYADRHKLPWTI